MEWEITLRESVLGDLRFFRKKEGRWILRELQRRLGVKPDANTRNVKTLRPNSIAQKELRLAGKYRVLFNLDEEVRTVDVILVGEKRGQRLIVRGEEFQLHHESDPPE